MFVQWILKPELITSTDTCQGEASPSGAVVAYHAILTMCLLHQVGHRYVYNSQGDMYVDISRISVLETHSRMTLVHNQCILKRWWPSRPQPNKQQRETNRKETMRTVSWMIPWRFLWTIPWQLPWIFPRVCSRRCSWMNESVDLFVNMIVNTPVTWVLIASWVLHESFR